MLVAIVVETLAAFHAQMPLLQVLLQILAWLVRHGLASCVSVVLLDVMDDVKSYDIHLLKWPFGGLENTPEDGVDLFGRAGAFRGCQKGLPFNSCPYPRQPLVAWVGRHSRALSTHLLYKYPIDGLRTWKGSKP